MHASLDKASNSKDSETKESKPKAQEPKALNSKNSSYPDPRRNAETLNKARKKKKNTREERDIIKRTPILVPRPLELI